MKCHPEIAQYALTNSGHIVQFQDGTSTPELLHPQINSSHFGPGYSGGLVVDQKNRLLYPGVRYLGRFDPSITKPSFTFTATNGGDDITNISGITMGAGYEEKQIVYSYNGKYYYWRIDVTLSTTSADMYGNFQFPTGTYSAYVMDDFDDFWKDFGGTLPDYTSEGDTLYMPTEVYEDTVLFMRQNRITTLNTVTDTVTTDASPAFTTPGVS